MGIYDQYASNLDYNSAWINWDDKTPAFVAMMCELTGESKHCDQLKTWCDGKIDGSPYSPKGEIFIDKWGSLRHAGNVAAICVRAASLGVNTDKDMAFARQQVNSSWAALAGASLWVMVSTHQPTAIIVEPPAMGQTAVATRIAPTQTRTCLLEPWSVDRERQMTTTTIQGMTM